MKGASMLFTLKTLGVIPSFNRPSVSDDNPYSESLFKTLKYHPSFPFFSKFNGISDARAWYEKFMHWYDHEHLHSSLKFVTPVQRHTGEDQMILMKRHQVYQTARCNNPQRWSRNTRNWQLPDSITLNPNHKIKHNTEKISYVDKKRRLQT